jgi:hypothetical protein
MPRLSDGGSCKRIADQNVELKLQRPLEIIEPLDDRAHLGVADSVTTADRLLGEPLSYPRSLILSVSPLYLD